MSKILIVDDDFDLASSIKVALEHEGFITDMAPDIEDAVEMLQGFDYDLIILDWMMPGGTGIDLLKNMRSKGVDTRVLMLTAMDDLQHMVQGLDSGADDYLTKPFSRSELIARTRALLRRPKQMMSTELVLAGVSLDTRSGKVTWNGSEVKLTKQEYQLLELLMRNKNQVLSADALIERAWSSMSEASPETVRVHMHRLRKKFEDGASKCPVETVHGRGYIFVVKD